MKHRSNNTKPSGGNLIAQGSVAAQAQNEIFLQNHQVTPQVHQLIDRLIEEESRDLAEHEETIRSACMLKHREVIYEAMAEYQRKGNFVRIYPSRQSHIYDQFFQSNRPINKILHRVLFSDKIMKLKGYSIVKQPSIKQSSTPKA
jgi:transcriptional/translational regulatory protein YebC/TACO1